MRFIYTKTFAIFAACLVAVSMLVIMQVKGWLDPVRVAFLNAPRPIIAATEGVTRPVKNFFVTIFQLREITKENASLRSRVAELEQGSVQADQQARENETLRKELGFVKSNKLDMTPCSVLSRDLLGAADAVVLNCGSAEGVTEGQAIVSQGYLVGKITYAGKHSSTALLLTSSQFVTDAEVSETGSPGVVRGSFNSGFSLDQIPQTSDLQTGWLVVTAGINEKIPKNLLIGEVSSLLSTSSDLFKKAALISPIDFKNLDFVFAVK